MDLLIRRSGDALLLMGLAIVPALAIWGFLAWWRSRFLARSVATRSAGLDVALFLSLLLIGVIGLRPGFGLPGGWDQWNFVPFRDLARSLDGRPWGIPIAVANLLVNIAFFVPWGFVYAFRFPRASWRSLLVLTVAMSLAVETWQAINASGRSSDVTDVLMNMTGGLLGFGIGRPIARRWLRPAS